MTSFMYLLLLGLFLLSTAYYAYKEVKKRKKSA